MRPTILVSVCALFSSMLPATIDAAEPQAGTREGIRRLSETGNLRGENLTGDPRAGAEQAMKDMAAQLQALYDMGGNGEPDEEGKSEIEERSAMLADAVGLLVRSLDRVRPPGDVEEPRVRTENYDARTLRMVTMYLDLVDPLTQFINEEALDNEVYDQLRSDLATIHAMALVLPESNF